MQLVLSVQFWQFSADGSEYPLTILRKFFFGTIKMAVYPKFFWMLVRNEIMEIFTGLILYILSLIKLIAIDLINSN